jgi:hypothetical protein
VDVYVECQTPTLIPLYRIVHFQIERAAREHTALPPARRRGKVLSAVYLVGLFRATAGTPHRYAFRLLIEPITQATSEQTRRPLATLH